jgi:8-oxo-dGTP pyrophosphatase MutT (NUDIX family)
MDKVTSLYKTKWVELMQRESEENGTYIYIQEPWLIDAKSVSILPYFYSDSGKIMYLLRHEHADIPVTGTVKGGCDKEGESPMETAIRELQEETGYFADEFDMIYLGTARSSKLNTTTMHLYAVNIMPLRYEKPLGDGTLNEANAYCEWVSEEKAIDSQDPMIHVSIMRLMKMCELICGQ